MHVYAFVAFFFFLFSFFIISIIIIFFFFEQIVSVRSLPKATWNLVCKFDVIRRDFYISFFSPPIQEGSIFHCPCKLGNVIMPPFAARTGVKILKISFEPYFWRWLIWIVTNPPCGMAGRNSILSWVVGSYFTWEISHYTCYGNEQG